MHQITYNNSSIFCNKMDQIIYKTIFCKIISNNLMSYKILRQFHYKKNSLRNKIFKLNKMEILYKKMIMIIIILINIKWLLTINKNLIKTKKIEKIENTL